MSIACKSAGCAAGCVAGDVERRRRRGCTAGCAAGCAAGGAAGSNISAARLQDSAASNIPMPFVFCAGDPRLEKLKEASSPDKEADLCSDTLSDCAVFFTGALLLALFLWQDMFFLEVKLSGKTAARLLLVHVQLSPCAVVGISLPLLRALLADQESVL